MKKKFLLLLILIIFIISWITLFLIFNYLDPFRNILVSVITLTLTFCITLTTFLTIIMYFFKKIYYRWEIFVMHIFTSLRQSLLISIFLVLIISFFRYWILSYVTILLLFLIFVFFELLFQNME